VRPHSPHGQDAPAPPNLTFPFALKAASRLPTPFAGLQLQARSLKFPSHSNPHVLTSLLNLYAKCALPHDAQWVFDEILRPSIVSFDGNKSLYLVFVGVVFFSASWTAFRAVGQHLRLLLEQLGQQHLGCFVRTAAS
jgi:hypothetical protein